jgi:hypothetical protein
VTRSTTAARTATNTTTSIPTSRAPLSPEDEDDRTEGPWFSDEEVANYPPVRTAASEALAEPGMPTPHSVNEIMYDYIKSLTPKKREKVLFSHGMYVHIMAVLRNASDNTTKTSNFRSWVRRTFTVQHFDGNEVLCHEHKPVAVREQVYEVLTHCHQQAGHGGRDKTSAQVST